jgi:selenocysteine lyase/cysteine desulfurase
MIDLEAVRADTPACKKVLHFNNAGASLMPEPVYDAVCRHLELENCVGGYEAERRAQDDLSAFYSELAGLLNASPDEIAYVENATRAWDMAFYGLPLSEGDRILTHGSEYASNYLALLQQAKRRRLHIDLIPSDASGQVDVSAISDLITDHTKLIAITHVPTQGGLINPAAEIGKIAKQHGVTYMLDACQSVGQLEIDVEKIGCDILSGTGRKFLRGPRGTGFLYVKRSMIEMVDPPFIDLLSATWSGDNSYQLVAGAKRYENWESYVAGRVGLMVAVRYARNLGLPAIEQRTLQLAESLRRELSDVSGVTMHDLGQHKCGIVTFTKDGVRPESMAQKLLAQGINISVSALSSARLDLGKRGLDALARASLHYFNTDAEIDRFVEAIRTISE